MAGMAEQAIGKAVKALVDRQAATAHAVIDDDAEINRLEVGIEDTFLGLRPIIPGGSLRTHSNSSNSKSGQCDLRTNRTFLL